LGKPVLILDVLCVIVQQDLVWSHILRKLEIAEKARYFFIFAAFFIFVAFSVDNEVA
jgi:hypothetical protein